MSRTLYLLDVLEAPPRLNLSYQTSPWWSFASKPTQMLSNSL